MQDRVKLSSDSLIEYLDFCRAIADAVCPTGEKGLEGIECVTGKIMIRHVLIPKSVITFGQDQQSWQGVLLSDDGRTLDELLPSDDSAMFEGHTAELAFGTESQKPLIGELPFPSPISENEQRVLAKILEDLPPLRYPMSDDERSAFMKAYCSLEKRPMWIPALVNDATVEQRKNEQVEFLKNLRQALRQEFEAGRLNFVDRYHTPVANPMADTFIPRSQAISYLERRGLLLVGDDVATAQIELDAVSKSDISPPESETFELSVDKKAVSFVHKQTLDERKAAVKLYRELKAKGIRDFAKQVAEKYQVDVRTIPNWLKEVEKDENKTSMPANFVRRRS